MNVLREKLERGECLFGSQVFLGSKEAAEALAGVGFDFLFICAEHTFYGIREVCEIVKYTQAAGSAALVRLPEFDRTYTKKILDCGVEAVLFPQIKGKADADRAMSFCLYPPYGDRGFGPQQAVRWGKDSEADYIRDTLRHGTLRMVQIEHIGAVNELETILENPYIDAFIFGPNDLAASLGHIGDMYHPDVQREVRRAAELLRSRNRAFGVSLSATDPDTIAYWKELGVRIFSLGTDYGFLRKAAEEVRERLYPVIFGKGGKRD